MTLFLAFRKEKGGSISSLAESDALIGYSARCQRELTVVVAWQNLSVAYRVKLRRGQAGTLAQ